MKTSGQSEIGDLALEDQEVVDEVIETLSSHLLKPLTGEPRARFLLGCALYVDGDIFSSYRELKAGLQLMRSQLPEHFHFLAQVCLACDEEVEAAQNFRVAIKLDPTFVPAYIDLLHLYADTHQREGNVLIWRFVVFICRLIGSA
ncbi:hypothetical protein CYMTET_56242 [Cymbomonas tetramitiformis]|uniref:Tetratricopeptide repeat protein n=1 Tax=Cymbomonas tetramitiformis TaxID=36881 RepID=A0AAE0BBN4_9CHLO|nr:hypothetical protein CYMTET_56242 [Cymbomonas tetramitiformis]